MQNHNEIKIPQALRPSDDDEDVTEVSFRIRTCAVAYLLAVMQGAAAPGRELTLTLKRVKRAA